MGRLIYFLACPSTSYPVWESVAIQGTALYCLDWFPRQTPNFRGRSFYLLNFGILILSGQIYVSVVLGVLLPKHINFCPVVDDVFFRDGLCAIMLVYQFYLLFGFCSRGYKFEDLLNRLNVSLHSCKFILMVLSNEIG